ncbi:LOW QUALITY PROTEIN: centrosomal protein 43 [Hippocampus comes]|uniref:LOW QUALITY PROTEIN: centrosomal protein 43 n=1 Tax=Hippocampus comes TaxID=109280 RepID=UPI00094EB353|nr:PREDICTED: LOW QUALITY PROTEIN: FGFR1 oncogene partner [Hippocampus comes]
MSATDDDTELRDLLIQNLENNGVLNKLKAEMRAAVFLALEEQDRLENKTPLVNENLKKCLETKDGRLVASLIVDFMRVFHLDFSLAVFQPEINTHPSTLDSRQLLCGELGFSEAELNANSPVLLELVRRGERKSKSVPATEVASQENSVTVDKDVAVAVFGHEELLQQAHVPQKDSARDLPVDREQQDDDDSFFDDPLPQPQKTYGLQPVARDSQHSPAGFLSETAPTQGGGGGGGASEKCHSQTGARAGILPISVSTSREKASQGAKLPSRGDESASLHFEDDNDIEYDDFNSHRSDLYKNELISSEEIEEVSIEGPDHSDKLEDTGDVSISQPSASLGCGELGFSEAELNANSPVLLELVRRGERKSKSVPATEVASQENSVTVDKDVAVAVFGHEELLQQAHVPQKDSARDLPVDREQQDDDDSFFDDPLPQPQKTYGLQPVARDSQHSPAGFLSETAPTQGGGGGGGASEKCHSQTGARAGILPISVSTSREKASQGAKLPSRGDESASLHFEDDNDIEYDDFNSHRSDLYKNELISSEEIEEVSIEGPDHSDKLEDTVDVSISQPSASLGVDYMEEVA